MTKNLFTKAELQRLRELPIERVASRLGLDVRQHRCLCPFHDDHTPSMTFSTTKNRFRCYVCGAHGSTIDLVMGVLFDKQGEATTALTDACKWLSKDFGVLMASPYFCTPKSGTKTFDPKRFACYFEQPKLSLDAKDFLFTKRHLHPSVVRYCRLNSYKDWLQIPYYDIHGNFMGIQSRYMGRDMSQPRFRFPRGNGCHIYNIQVLKMLRTAEDLYIAEGCSDCWALLSAGHKTMAIPSATLLDTEELKNALVKANLIENRNTLHVYPDQDMAGESLYEKLHAVATDVGIPLVRHNLPSGCKDFSDFWISQQNNRMIQTRT